MSANTLWHSGKKAALNHQIESAQSFGEWRELALQHDSLTGASAWRNADKTSLYDHAEIKARYRKLNALLNDKNHRELLFNLNEGVHGNMCGMGHPLLYTKAMSGTKTLIDKYVSAIARSLRVIADAPDSRINTAEKIDFFRRASHCYGRSALLLSGGAGLIYFHHGAVQELINHKLLPNVISGASSGSLIAAQLGILSDAELAQNHFNTLRYSIPDTVSLSQVISGKVQSETLARFKEETLDGVVQMDLTFQEAFEHTGRYINISVSPADRHQTSRLMNAITAPNVYIRSAVSASCSLPGLMPAERLYAKGFDGKPRPYLASRRWVDGSVSGDLPAKRLARLFGVNHFIVSLINFFVSPFITDTKQRARPGFASKLQGTSIEVAKETAIMLETLVAKSSAKEHPLLSQILHLIGILEQNYLGDINILCRKRDFKLRNIAFEYQDLEIEELIAAGARSTWPKIPMIKNTAMISKELDTILEEFEMPRTHIRQS